MIRRQRMFFTVAGSFALAVSIALQHWMHGEHADVASGFLMGVSIGLLILGLARPSRRTSR
jgi:hypothetical protein